MVEIVDSSSGEETSSSSSDSDDCIMLSDSELPASPEAEEDPNNSGKYLLCINTIILVSMIMYGREAWVWQKKNACKFNSLEI